MLAPITWEENKYRWETYDGFFTNNEEVRIKKLDDETGVIHWGKWVYYSICVFDSVEDYREGEENYDMETPCYVGYEEDIPEEENLHTMVWGWKEGMILQIHPRRYAGVEFSLVDGEVNWDTWDNGESYVDSTYIIQDGKCILWYDED